MESDDDLKHFALHGAAPLPAAVDEGFVDNDGARIAWSTYGTGNQPVMGQPVVLLHGGLGHRGNWGYQVPALVGAGYRAILIDSRGHGRSTRDVRPYSYELMASDVLAVLDALHVQKAAFVGWSDGACTALVLARRAPERVAGVFFFACNMDPSGAKEFVPTPVIERCFKRHREDYETLSATPDDFDAFVAAVSEMQRTQPNYSADDLARIGVRVVVAIGENDEFIRQEHAAYLAQTIPDAELIVLPNVTHFAPLQRPALFNGVIERFAGTIVEAGG
ncbi:Alpha/beta hydrolase fold protein [Paraburkholderia piptadeniae]|uniref:Alpha/beta hydrolase fold protein n=1 Tax=Paraburkholderia piptadeniae TaxID=1701573 RepID=A0A1N7SJ19_9BURK|nr:alpha/beta hydrolase [Paraburkholderia piptadeniae]SIT47419.1 Alpha/beta hydrolase fold protein [Paraburkholderia piptadeniae]